SETTTGCHSEIAIYRSRRSCLRGPIAFESLVNCVADLQAFIEYAKAVAACILHAVHRGVGVAQKFFVGAAALRVDGDSDADGETDFPTANLNGLRDFADNLAAASLNVLDFQEIGHDDNELISAHA